MSYSDKLVTGLGLTLLVVIAMVFGSLLVGYPLKWFINYTFNPALIQTIFGTSRVGFWQAFGLNFVITGLLKSTSTGGSK